MSDKQFLKFKEKNLLELLEQLEISIKFGEENIEYMVQTNPDLNRLIGARESLEISKREFEEAKKELSEVRQLLSKV